jgi:hypothetical protein
MMVPEATALVNAMAFLPGWTVVAEDATRRYQDAIRITFTIAARNSDEEHAPRYRATVPGGARSSFVITVADLDVGGLVAAVVDAAVVAFEHEAREFSRVQVGPAWWAPVHPHIPEGIARWASLHGTDPARDFTFGLA